MLLRREVGDGGEMRPLKISGLDASSRITRAFQTFVIQGRKRRSGVQVRILRSEDMNLAHYLERPVGRNLLVMLVIDGLNVRSGRTESTQSDCA
jgi:hypothetical protein